MGRGNLNGLHAASVSQNLHGNDPRTVEGTFGSSTGIACACYAARGRACLLRIFPANLCATGSARIWHLSQRKKMMKITAPELEIAVLVLGMMILLVEAFITKIDKRILAFAAIAGLAMVFFASFF